MIILAIESSCDETGVGIAELGDDGTIRLLADEVASSVDEHARYGGVVPQIAAVMGPCAAGTAYIPGLADFVPMVSGRGSMALAGPHLVRAAIGEDVTQAELAGSRVHTRKSGVGGIARADQPAGIAGVKQ